MTTPLLVRTLEGALWAAFGRWGQILVGVVTVLVMARWLGPETYGLFTLVMAAVWFGDVMFGGGLSESLVQREPLENAHIQAIFSISLLGALIYGAALIAAAPWLSALLDARVVEAVIPPLCVVLIANAAACAPMALLQRALRQDKIVAIEGGAGLASSALGIALALMGLGIWALVAMEIARAVLRAGAALAVANWRPRLALGWSAFGAQWRFNRAVLGVRYLQYVDRTAPRVILGAVAGEAAVGFFALGWRLYEQIQTALVTPLSGLALPAAARAAHEPRVLRALLLGAARFSSLIAYPAFIGAAAIAPVAVPLAFGEAWRQAVPTIQILSLIGLRSAVSAFNGGVMRGLGRPDLQARVVLVGAGLTLALSAVAAPFGAAWVAGAVLARNIATWPLGAAHVARLTGVGLAAQAKAGAGPLLAALAMGAAVLGAQMMAPRMGVISCIALIAAGAAIYVVAVRLIAPDLLRTARAATGALMRRDRAALAALLAAR